MKDPADMTEAEHLHHESAYEASPRGIAERLQKEGMHCNCDLDNWEPERSTGHSHVCRIHKMAIKLLYG